MGEVWYRPSLTALEVLWRWSAGIPLLWLAFRAVSGALTSLPLDWAALQNLTVFKPLEAASTLSRQLGLLTGPAAQIGRWLIPLLLVVWSLASAFGRTAVFRRLHPSLHRRPAFLAATGFVRLVVLLVVLGIWVGGAGWAAHWAIVEPGQRGADPDLVLYTAVVVGLTLALFVAWSLSSWVLDLAPLVAVTSGEPIWRAIRAAMRSRELRSKLIELNFVMGIVKVCLLVLAMTFSASPLPFENQQTQGFIDVWWTGVAILYLLASDFFHVVRRVTYLRLLISLGPETNTSVKLAS